MLHQLFIGFKAVDTINKIFNGFSIHIIKIAFEIFLFLLTSFFDVMLDFNSQRIGNAGTWSAEEISYSVEIQVKSSRIKSES